MKIRLEKKCVVTAVLAVAAAVAVTGCGVGEDTSSTSSFDLGDIGGTTNVGADSLSIAKVISPKGFLVMWSKRSGGYGEVIYTDDLNKKRGNGYPLTANAKGVYSLKCEEVSSNSSGADYSCKASNVSYSRRVHLENGVEYKWLVNYGFEHTHGEVEATMTYRNGTLIVE